MENYEKMAKLAVEKSLLKEYNTSDSKRTVYMKDKDEFQIQLFNPTTGTIGATISINGKEINGMLVLKPGERVWLERYIDDAVKFRFETYDVDSDDADVKAAIANNGNITVKFYKEKEKIKFSNMNINRIRTTPNTTPNWYDGGCFNDNITYLSSSAPTTSFGNEITASCYYNDTLSLSDEVNTAIDAKITTSAANTMETGRIGKGNYSNQKFENVELDFEYYPFYTADLKILPISRKLVSSSDLQKIYCTECGRKLNTKFKFCPYCGTSTSGC